MNIQAGVGPILFNAQNIRNNFLILDLLLDNEKVTKTNLKEIAEELQSPIDYKKIYKGAILWEYYRDTNFSLSGVASTIVSTKILWWLIYDKQDTLDRYKYYISKVINREKIERYKIWLGDKIFDYKIKWLNDRFFKYNIFWTNIVEGIFSSYNWVYEEIEKIEKQRIILLDKINDLLIRE